MKRHKHEFSYPARSNYPAEKPKSEKEQAHEESLAELAKKFERGETPYTLDELRKQMQGIAEEWKSDGFEYGYGEREVAFIDENGGLLMLAPHSESYDPGTQDASQTWRVLFDDMVVTLTPPKEFRGRGIHWRSGTGTDNVYDAPLVRGAETPEDLQPLIDRFGDHLGMSYDLFGTSKNNTPQYSLRSERGEFCELSEVAAKIEQDYNADWNEALAVEGEAQAAKSAVRKRLFMTARKHMQLQEAAYRDSINRSMSR